METMQILLLAISLLLQSLSFTKENPFGFIAYQTHSANIGDDIQAIAAKQFLPSDSVPIDRDQISQYKFAKKVPTIISGWFMYSNATAVPFNGPFPNKSWPPSKDIDPFFISLHIWSQAFPLIFSEEGITYLKKHAPIGARDLTTLRELQKRGIPSYFSGCLTLTLKNRFKKRADVIYAVDLSPQCIDYIRSHTKHRVKIIHHGAGIINPRMQPEQRFKIAQNLLDKYAQARCIVTTRLHGCLPCLALQTPVLYLGGKNDRVSGMDNLYIKCSPKDLISGKFKYDFNNPPPNPNTYLILRKKLIDRVGKWIIEKEKR